jgi:hypothetical protein
LPLSQRPVRGSRHLEPPAWIETHSKRWPA